MELLTGAGQAQETAELGDGYGVLAMHEVFLSGKNTDLLTAGAVQRDRYILTTCKNGLVHYSSKLSKNGRVSTTLGIYSTYCQNGYCLVSAV